MEPNEGLSTLVEAFKDVEETAPEAAPETATSAPETPPAEPAAKDTTTAETPPPAAPATTPPQQSAVDHEFMRTILEQNKGLSNGLQSLAESQRAIADRLLQEAKPELTQAQREEKIQSAFAELNADPDAFVRKIVAAERAQLEAEFSQKYATRDAAAERQQVVAKNLAALYQNEHGDVLRPELNDPEFMKVMVSPELQQEVASKFYRGKSPAEIAATPTFYTDLYHATVAKQAARGQVAQNEQQSEKDKNAQRDIIASHGAPAPGSGGKPGSISQKLADVNKAEVDAILGVSGASNRLFGDAKWDTRK